MNTGAGTESRAWILTVREIATRSPDGGSVQMGDTEYWVTTVRLQGPEGRSLPAPGPGVGHSLRQVVLVSGKDGVLTPLDVPYGGRILNIGVGKEGDRVQRPAILRPATGEEIEHFRADQYDLLWRFQAVIRTLGSRDHQGPGHGLN